MVCDARDCYITTKVICLEPVTKPCVNGLIFSVRRKTDQFFECIPDVRTGIME